MQNAEKGTNYICGLQVENNKYRENIQMKPPFETMQHQPSSFLRVFLHLNISIWLNYFLP
jgi:hypothetical protein